MKRLKLNLHSYDLKDIHNNSTFSLKSEEAEKKNLSKLNLRKRKSRKEKWYEKKKPQKTGKIVNKLEKFVC